MNEKKGQGFSEEYNSFYPWKMAGKYKTLYICAMHNMQCACTMCLFGNTQVHCNKLFVAFALVQNGYDIVAYYDILKHLAFVWKLSF